jgi:hypothetical protein
VSALSLKASEAAAEADLEATKAALAEARSETAARASELAAAERRLQEERDKSREAMALLKR